MHRVRYYERLIEPYYFDRGVRGWWIRTLNRVRLWVEGCVAYHVMRYLAAEDGLSRKQQKPWAKQFMKDLKEETALCREPEPTRPARLDDGTPVVQQGRKRGLGTRLRTEQMLARMLQDKRRQRYTKGTQSSVGDPDGDFTEVPDVPPGGTLPNVEVSYARGEQPKKTNTALVGALRRDGAQGAGAS